MWSSTPRPGDAPGATVDLEEFSPRHRRQPRRPVTRLPARSIATIRHRKFAEPPAGWCSWYCFGPRVTSQQVLDNLDTISKDIPGLRYVQIDDGYHPPWAMAGNRQAFGGDVLGVLKQIRKKGFEPLFGWPLHRPADSHLFQQHPAWFMKGDDGKPLPSNQVTSARGGMVPGMRWTEPTRSPEASRRPLPGQCDRSGLHLFQARRKFLGRHATAPHLYDPKAPASKPTGVACRHSPRSRRQFHSRLQSPDLGIVRID